MFSGRRVAAGPVSTTTPGSGTASRVAGPRRAHGHRAGRARRPHDGLRPGNASRRSSSAAGSRAPASTSPTNGSGTGRGDLDRARADDGAAERGYGGSMVCIPIASAPCSSAASTRRVGRQDIWEWDGAAGPTARPRGRSRRRGWNHTLAYDRSARSWSSTAATRARAPTAGPSRRDLGVGRHAPRRWNTDGWSTTPGASSTTRLRLHPHVYDAKSARW